MFVTLLLITFIIAAATSTVIAFLFSKPIKKILGRLITEELAPTWQRYLLFAIYVVGISGGVRVWDIEKYITPDKEGKLLALNSDRWVIEIYKTVIGTLQSVAWMLLIFFLFALLAYVVVRGLELKRMANTATPN
ncbi:hypothetical protein L0337_24200 [candidate division KSB1 bacterium]|nr:hypothetical protein [candidate division KSB1 bacterium]